MPRETVTFQPNELAKSLLKKALGKKPQRGAQTRVVNKAIVEFLKSYIGKREQHLLDQP